MIRFDTRGSWSPSKRVNVSRRKKIVLGIFLILGKTFLFGSSPFLYLDVLFGSRAQFVSIEPRPDRDFEGPKIGGDYKIVDEASMDAVDRVSVATALFLGDLSNPVIFGAGCFDPRHGLRLNGYEVAVCVHCLGIVRWSATGNSQGGIGPLGGAIWEWVRQRHHLKPPQN